MEGTLDNDNSEIVNAATGYIERKSSKKSKCEDYPSNLYGKSVDIMNGIYLHTLSRGVFMALSSNLT